MIESLESRKLLAATLADGLLTVTGSSANDTITVRAEGTLLVLTVNDSERNFRLRNVNRISINGLAGDDTLMNLTTIRTKLIGGDGADEISGGNTADTLIGGGGNDRLNGNAGNDLLDGGAGNDTLVGGAGRDTVTYYSRKVPVRIFLNGLPSGAAGEADLIAGVENARGGRANDTIRGDAGDNRLFGGPGNDTITGHNGADSLCGEDGDDRLIANDGASDIIRGGNGTDSALLDAGKDQSDAENILN